MKRYITALLGLALLVSCSANNSTYYFDPDSGNDANTGTSSVQPLRSLARIRSLKINPGDSILLKSGAVFTEKLWFTGKGAVGKPVVIGKYGGEKMPYLKGDGSCREMIHGEGRNGGTPDWILKKKYLVDRSSDPVYKTYVEKYFAQIGKQLQGLMFKDNGPVIGIQLENEYWKGKAGEPYILWLKQTARKYGMDVPLYTVTGWGDGSVPPGEVIPLWGGYPDESWTPNIEKITGRGNYTFSSFRDDETIGNAQVKKKDNYLNHSNLPYFTCEMGVGIFVSTHRRPVIGPIDGLGMLRKIRWLPIGVVSLP